MVAHSAERFLCTKATRAQRMMCKRSVPASVAGPCTKTEQKRRVHPRPGDTECPEIPPVQAGRGWGGTDFKDTQKQRAVSENHTQALQEPSSAALPGTTEIIIFLFNTALYCLQYLGASIAPSAQLERKHTLAQELVGEWPRSSKKPGALPPLCV